MAAFDYWIGLDTYISKNGLNMFPEILQKASKYLEKFPKYLEHFSKYLHIYQALVLDSWLMAIHVVA